MEPISGKELARLLGITVLRVMTDNGSWRPESFQKIGLTLDVIPAQASVHP